MDDWLRGKSRTIIHNSSQCTFQNKQTCTRNHKIKYILIVTHRCAKYVKSYQIYPVRHTRKHYKHLYTIIIICIIQLMYISIYIYNIYRHIYHYCTAMRYCTSSRNMYSSCLSLIWAALFFFLAKPFDLSGWTTYLSTALTCLLLQAICLSQVLHMWSTYDLEICFFESTPPN